MERARLLELLARELERPRALTAQVVQHLTGTYGLERDVIGGFLDRELGGLEDYQVDLILSPLFTPALGDQAIFAGHLEGAGVAREEWPALIEALRVRPTVGRLETEDGSSHAVPLREVVLERYVHRLRLAAVVPDALLRLIRHLGPEEERPWLLAVARRAAWEIPARREILVRYLTVALAAAEGYRREDAVELLRLVETYAPADAADLLARMPAWEKQLRQELQTGAGGPKPFFNERVEELHGGGRDQRRQDNARMAARQRELDSLLRLQRALAPEVAGTGAVSA